MSQYKVIGIDLAKKKFHLAALNIEGEVAFTKAINRREFFAQLSTLFPTPETFAFEACGGCHYTAQCLQELGHQVILLKPKDVKPYAKSRQKNDINDAIAICRAACDPLLMWVQPKTKAQQEVAYLHKARANAIRHRIQRSNSLMTSLQEFGYVVECGKARFAKDCEIYVKAAHQEGYVCEAIYAQMLLDCEEIAQFLGREKSLDHAIAQSNKEHAPARVLAKIPGIGPINASVLSHKPMALYKSAKDFAASLGLVPKQNTTGGTIKLGSITKQGDRYARTMLIQAGRAIVMRTFKGQVPSDPLYKFAQALRAKGKHFNVICVAVANKLARIAYGCVQNQTAYHA